MSTSKLNAFFETLKKINKLSSDQELCALLEITPQRLSNYRQGIRSPNIKWIQNAVEAANCSPTAAGKVLFG